MIIAANTVLRGALVLACLSWATGTCWADPVGKEETSSVKPFKLDSALPGQSSHLLPAPFGQRPAGAFGRMLQRRHEIEAQRRQRILEMEAARKVREADRAVWLKRWKEQRHRAREQSLERERHYHRELAQRFPELAAHRQRHAKELERRRQALEKERQARWQALDALAY